MEAIKLKTSVNPNVKIVQKPHEVWERKQILLLAFLCRIVLVFYARIHDYLFEVPFTDTDYKVYSDAANYVYYGQSPYQRATYRYTPFLAWLLLPVVKWPDFGKILFCTVDIAVGFFYFELPYSQQVIDKRIDESKLKKSVVIFWLVNPFTAIISSRGNADVLVCSTVLWTLYLLIRNKWCLAALVYGWLAVHLKLYPIIYLPSIFLALSDVSSSATWMEYCKRIILNMKGYVFVLILVLSLMSSVAFCYKLYGMSYLNEALLYHLYRTDTRHNFSPYFYVLYLTANDTQLLRFIGFCAFIPQASLILWLAFRFHEDLPFCWLLTTLVFVSFNKVCTSQYFIWYICLLPIAQRSVKISTKNVIFLILLWLMAQSLWLIAAYLFEFHGVDTFFYMWFTSLLFLAVNTLIIIYLIQQHIYFQKLEYDMTKNYNFLRLYLTFLLLLLSMLFLIGLGLGNVDDITMRGKAVVDKCSSVYLETYTSVMSFGLRIESLETFFDKKIKEADRIMIETNFDQILEEARVADVCILVVGDPFGATTHINLVLSARKAKIPVEIIHNASIINAVGCCGLQLYRFGEIISVVFWEENWKPDSYYHKIKENKKRGLHTLCLLDIKTKEQSIENLMKGRNEFLKPRYMTCAQAVSQLLEIAEEQKQAGFEPILTKTTLCVGLARIGWDNQKIVFCSMQEMRHIDMGPPLHSLIIPGDLHPLELEFLESFLTVLIADYKPFCIIISQFKNSVKPVFARVT
ncbi:unnamed protein product [Thelazia callipaeda]|uniref:GPI alpha-1,4-mannosyltransferase I, catalytic subunit n=1 Tax=Thelazia callipaeda TaxID=103827 RepID=A0A0N5CKP9_THECL|nr:unnamed protein product [Thelazia callipaeda]